MNSLNTAEMYLKLNNRIVFIQPGHKARTGKVFDQYARACGIRDASAKMMHMDRDRI